MHTTDHHALAAALASNDPFTPPYDHLNPDTLSVAGLLDAALAARRLTGHAEAFQARIFAALEKRIRAEDAGSSRGRGATESELSATLHLPPATLRGMLADAGALCERFPETLAQLSTGAVSRHQVRPLLELTSCLSDEHARAVQERVLPEMAGHTPRRVHHRVQTAIHEIDPEGAAQRHAQRAKTRHLALHPEPDGMATLSIFLKAETALAIQAKVNAACAKRAKGDPRTLDQRRVDTLAEMILTGGGAGPGPATMVHLVVNIESLIGLSDTPAQLEGYGPLTPGQARTLTLAPGSQLRRLFVTPTGKLVAVDPHQYRLPAWLDRYLRLLNRTCTFPGCGMPAWRSDLDHMLSYAEGGCTCEDNLHPACRRHHNEKTAGLWTTDKDGDGTVWISTETGRPYTSTPEPYPHC